VTVKSARARTRHAMQVHVRRLSAPFDDAQGNRYMGLFQQPAENMLDRILTTGEYFIGVVLVGSKIKTMKYGRTFGSRPNS
jgi:hypothetical protein